MSRSTSFVVIVVVNLVASRSASSCFYLHFDLNQVNNSAACVVKAKILNLDYILMLGCK
jgi:hypothetical protein